jgi:hypothetical protein
VLILRLVFNALARAKLAARGITTREIEEVVANGRARQPQRTRARLDLRDRPDHLSALPDGRTPA